MTDEAKLFRSLAAKVGTPFWLYDARILRKRIKDILHVTAPEGVQARYAMKACPASKVLREMRAQGIWIDAVSGNEALRALCAGFPPGHTPPVICFTADAFRDNALSVVLEHGLLPNIGSPGMVAELARAGYRGPISVRINPGFGHGHVNACDTGGPSSKHGIWHSDLQEVVRAADAAGMTLVMLHAHIGSGPQFAELQDNLRRLAAEFAELATKLPGLEGVSLGGGIPHNYRDPHAEVPLDSLRSLFMDAHQRISAAVGRSIRLEIEPGRYYVAPACTLISRVSDVKMTRSNDKGRGGKFAMVDAGFVDLVRPAMYGSFHRIEVVGKASSDAAEGEDIVVAGPLCESGDVFTRDEAELLVPRRLPKVAAGDLLAIRDAGAYGFAMSSNYNSIGRAPQLWLEEDGSVEMLTRRETLDDLLATEAGGEVVLRMSDE